MSENHFHRSFILFSSLEKPVVFSQNILALSFRHDVAVNTVLFRKPIKLFVKWTNVIDSCIEILRILLIHSNLGKALAPKEMPVTKFMASLEH